MQAQQQISLWLQQIEANVLLYSPAQKKYIAKELLYIHQVIGTLQQEKNSNNWDAFATHISNVIAYMPTNIGNKQAHFDNFKKEVHLLQKIVAKQFGYTMPIPFQNIGLLAGVVIGILVGFAIKKLLLWIAIATIVGLLWGSFMDKWQQKNRKLIQ